MKKVTKLKHYRETRCNLNTLKGEIYENYCYEIIVNQFKSINFINMETYENPNDGFYINAVGDICYKSDSIDLGEFDILGFDNENNLHWFEITKQQKNLPYVIDKIERKKELLLKLFNTFTFYLVIPEKNDALEKLSTNTIIIPEPKYDSFIKKEFQFNFENNNFINIDVLIHNSKKYSYINEIISLSKKFFQGVDSNFKSYLYERLYDVNNMSSNSFKYFDVEKKRFGEIHISSKGYFKDKKRISIRKAAYKELQQIRYKMKSK